MNLLVTGGAGFIGANFVRYWLEKHPGDNVAVLDLLTYAGVRENVPDGVPLDRRRHLRRRPRRAALQEHAVDVIVNFAAESHNSLRGPRSRPLLPYERARHADAARGGAARRHRALPPHLHLRGLRRPRPRRPGRPSPRSRRTGRARPYNASKAAADHYVRAYHETFGLPITITNCSNNYGPCQFPEKVIPFFTHARAGRQVRCRSTRPRDHARVAARGDHCRAIEQSCSSAAASARPTTWGPSVEALDRRDRRPRARPRGKPDSLKTIVPDRPGHDRRYLLDSPSCAASSGGHPQIEFERACARRSSGTPPTVTGGSRSRTAPPSWRPPGHSGV